MSSGDLVLVLHAHLPFVRHPEHKDFMEERWLYEAITETYIPLLDVFNRLLAEDIPYRITMSLSAPLTEMLSDPLLQERYIAHLDRLIELSEKEVERTKGDSAFHQLALMYREKFVGSKQFFDDICGRNLIPAFRRLQDMGRLELITCAGTHGFLPNMLPTQQSVRAHIRQACSTHAKNFGAPPRGMWLPECGYYPGYDKYLKEQDINYFFVDTHGVMHSSPRPKYGVYAPIQTPAGVYCFGRDAESSKQVWSQKEGYPGDFHYREYYRDIGHDLEHDYIEPYIHPDGIRINTGVKYHRITGNGDYKEPYQPGLAREKAAEHAGNFMFNREKQVEYLSQLLGKSPVIVAPYDAELYGHWWYEGPQFLEFLIRKVAFDSKTIQLSTASDYLFKADEIQPSEPSFSTWGYKGYGEVWLDGSNDWIYRHLHEASARMKELNKHFEWPGEMERRALNQATRELMLAESSDWAFIMKTGTVTSYAVERTRKHLLNFFRLHDELVKGKLNKQWLEELESKNTIFQDIHPQIYS